MWTMVSWVVPESSFLHDFSICFCLSVVYCSFYMPHGLEIDGNDSVWITDVALHQVLINTDINCCCVPLLTFTDDF